MKTNKLVLALAAAAPLLLFSCKKEVETPEITYQLKASTAATPVSARMMGGSLQWTSGYAWASEIEFEAENNSVEVEYKTETRQKVDLFSPLSTLGTVSVPPGTYEEIEFEVEVQPNGSEPALQLSGTFTDGGGATVPVIFKLSSGLEIESEQTHVTITDGASLTALTTLNLSLLTTGVTESMLQSATRTSGVIEISATSNTNIYNLMLANLAACSEVEVDD